MKHIDDFESFKKINEINFGGVEVYPFTVRDNPAIEMTGGNIYYNFTAENDLNYTVMLVYDKTYNWVKVEFGVGPGLTMNGRAITNNGDMYKVISTVGACVKDFHENHPSIKRYLFAGQFKKGETGNAISSRTRLYLEYVRSCFPDARVMVNGNDVEVNINQIEE